MASQRDKDYHKLRNPEKYNLDSGYSQFSGQKTKEDAEADTRYQTLWNKYGGKSMVGDKRRRNSTRKSNQKAKQTDHQTIRSRGKEQVRLLIQDPENHTVDL